MVTEQSIRELKRAHSVRLLSLPGVCGVGVEKDAGGEFFLAVHVNAAKPEAGIDVPDQIDGCPVRKIRSGPFAKQ